MEQQDRTFPVPAEELDERRRCDQERRRSSRSRPRVGVAAGRPAEQRVGEHEARLATVQHEGAIREALESDTMQPPPTRARADPLDVELGVDRVRALLVAVELTPEIAEAPVVRTAAERARTVSRRERSRLAEDEQPGEAAGLQERRAAPAAELEPARDPALHREAAANHAVVVVQAAAVAVDEPALSGRDQLAERRDSVLARHLGECAVAALDQGAGPS